MNELFSAIILGITQGITEFLPISSSGHLIILPWMFKFKDPGLTFDVILHLATAIALLIYFWTALINLFFAFFKSIKDRKISDSQDKKLAWFILLACIPAGLTGVLFEDIIESAFRNPLLVAGALIIFALILLLAEKLSSKKDGLSKITWQKALIIGLAQALALIPGVSRAGITMTAGLFLGFKRESSAKFSFLMATPIMFGAGILKLKDLSLQNIDLPLIAGFLTTIAVSFFTIKFLLTFLQKHSFQVFVWYRIILGLLIIFIF